MPCLKIVVVDDDDLVRGVVCATLRELIPTAQVDEYATSLEVIREVETGTVDLLITNCHMPDMDGPSLVRTLRERKYSLPIIMISGSDGARELGEKAGIDRFVAKHALHTELSESVFSLLELPRH